MDQHKLRQIDQPQSAGPQQPAAGSQQKEALAANSWQQRASSCCSQHQGRAGAGLQLDAVMCDAVTVMGSLSPSPVTRVAQTVACQIRDVRVRPAGDYSLMPWEFVGLVSSLLLGLWSLLTHISPKNEVGCSAARLPEAGMQCLCSSQPHTEERREGDQCQY